MGRQLELTGIIPATVLPLTADYQIDEDTLKDYIRWVTRSKVRGLATNVGTGEGPHLYRDPHQRTRRRESGLEEGRDSIDVSARNRPVFLILP